MSELAETPETPTAAPVPPAPAPVPTPAPTPAQITPWCVQFNQDDPRMSLVSYGDIQLGNISSVSLAIEDASIDRSGAFVNVLRLEIRTPRIRVGTVRSVPVPAPEPVPEATASTESSTTTVIDAGPIAEPIVDATPEG